MRGRGGPGGGSRADSVRLRTAKGRSASSQRWLRRQLNDPWVQEARRLGYRSRAAFKLLQLDERFRLLRPGLRAVDLGAAPGGWTQVAAARLLPGGGGAGRLVALDLLEMDPVAGADILRADFMTEDGLRAVLAALDGEADLVLSDMAAPATGHAATDRARTEALCEAAWDFAARALAPGGAFVAKVYRGGTERSLLARVNRAFAAVRHAKPPASRPESPETYLVARGFRGAAEG